MLTQDQLDAHCKRGGCRCDHLECYQGWNTHDETTAAPCQYCRPSLHERLWKAQAARAKGYPTEAVHRILRTVDNAKQ